MCQAQMQLHKHLYAIRAIMQRIYYMDTKLNIKH